MKHLPILLALLVPITTICPAAFAIEPIPQKYWGLWGSSAACHAWFKNKQTRMGAPEGGALISKTELAFAASGCYADTILAQDKDTFKAKFACSGDGEEWSRTITLRSSQPDTLHIDQDPPLKRCVQQKK